MFLLCNPIKGVSGDAVRDAILEANQAAQGANAPLSAGGASGATSASATAVTQDAAAREKIKKLAEIVAQSEEASSWNDRLTVGVAAGSFVVAALGLWLTWRRGSH